MISNCRLNRLNLGNRFLALIFLAGAVNVEDVVESGDIYRLPVSSAIQVFALIAGGLKKSSIGLDTTLWFLYESTKRHDGARTFARLYLKDERAAVFRRESRSEMMLLFHKKVVQ